LTSKSQIIRIVSLIGLLTLSACSFFRTEAENELVYISGFCAGESLVGEIEGIKAKATLQRNNLDSIQAELGAEKYTKLSQDLQGYTAKAELLNRQIQAACRPYAICKYRSRDTASPCDKEQKVWDEHQRAIRDLILEMEKIEGEIKKAESKKGPTSSITHTEGNISASAQSGFAIINTGPSTYNLYYVPDVSDAVNLGKVLKDETASEKQNEYLKNKLAFIANQFEDIKKDQLTVRSTASIFTELMRLAETAKDSICSINHRPEVWQSMNNPMSFVYGDYLKENAKSADKKGISISRVWVLDKQRRKDPGITKSAQRQAAANVSLYIVDSDEITRVNAYQKMATTYRGMPSNVPFKDLNIASYDNQIVVYTLAYSSSNLKLPSQLMITWKKDEVDKLNPCDVVQELRKAGKLPYEHRR
jgi:hypothetical protein